MQHLHHIVGNVFCDIIQTYKGEDMKETKIQWHPGFVAAMNLEFARNSEGLIFEKEYNLNTKPLEIDLLVIKKETSVRIENDRYPVQGP